jgi:hypothetical protein
VVSLFILTCHERVGGEEIRTYDLRFIKRGSQPIELPLRDISGQFISMKKSITS